MKSYKNIRSLCFVLALIPVMLLLASCGSGATFKEAGGRDVVDSASGKTWHHASACYEAVELGESVGKLQVTKKESYNLHQIKDMSPDAWLATEDGFVLYSHGTTLPTLQEMQATAMTIYADTESATKLHHITDAQSLAGIMTQYIPDNTITYPSRTPIRSYSLKFASESYPGLYYCLTYIEYADDYTLGDVNYGKYFLYNRSDKVFVPMDDSIHAILGIE